MLYCSFSNICLNRTVRNPDQDDHILRREEPSLLANPFWWCQSGSAQKDGGSMRESLLLDHIALKLHLFGISTTMML
jgi:hypothetical protein